MRLAMPTRFSKIHQAGFSLLELIVVCALIGIMLTVATPVLRDGLYSDPLKSSTRKLINLIKIAREQATGEQKYCRLGYDSGEQQFFVQLLPRTQGGGWELEDLDIQQSFTLPESVRLHSFSKNGTTETTSDTLQIWFNPRGYNEQAAIHLTNDDDDVMSIHLEPFVTEVSIFNVFTPFVNE